MTCDVQCKSYGDWKTRVSDPTMSGGPFGDPLGDERRQAESESAAGAPSNKPWSIPESARQPPVTADLRWSEAGAGPPETAWTTPSSDQSPQGRPKSWPRRHRFATVALCLALIAIGAFLGVAIAHGFWLSRGRTVAKAPSSSASNSIPLGGGSAAGGSIGSPSPFQGAGSDQGSGGSSSSAAGSPSDVSAVAAKVAPTLVDLNMTLADGSSAAATGIVLTASGLVLTNNHAVEGASTIKATDLGNGRTYTATVRGYDPSEDIALIRLQGASRLASATLADSAAVSVGRPVVGIGNAGGVGGTPSAAGGRVVALGQEITASDSGSGTAERLSGLIETNADIQPGDSGGPLVNAAGQVIGMDTAASSGFSFGSLSTSQGEAFAIPIDAAADVVAQIENGQSSATVHVGATAFLGVEVARAADQRGLDGSSSTGALIVGVLAGSPAARADLASGDTIVSVDGKSVKSPSGLTTLFGAYRPGKRVVIGWTDQSGQHTSRVTLASGPAQ